MKARVRTKKVPSHATGPTTLVPPLNAPRRLSKTLLDFRTLHLPSDVAVILSDAFWQRFGSGPRQTIRDHWYRLKYFGRFNKETRAIRSLRDLQGNIVVRYLEWLNAQRAVRGTPLGKSTRCTRYMTICNLLEWVVRCQPGLLAPIDWPVNPFPWRNRDTRGRQPINASQVREILKACEHDITQIRIMRERGRQLRQDARAAGATYKTHLGAVLDFIDSEFGGVLPSTTIVARTHRQFNWYLLYKHGGVDATEPFLYPNPHVLFPYYLAIVLHTAGNPQAIAEMGVDCLQAVPLLSDREILRWEKPRAKWIQRRSFRTSAPFEPPALVREVIEWTRALRGLVQPDQRSRLWLMKTRMEVTAANRVKFSGPLKSFIKTHKLTPFSIGSLRPSVLSALYRSTGDLRTVKAMANHASISTTMRYVRGPQVIAQNTARMAALQSALLGHIEPSVDNPPALQAAAPAEPPPPGAAVSMFGFSCNDPFSGIAPGTRRGDLCTNFLACLTCPNAVIPTDAPTLARLLHARDHLQAAAAHIHPARWTAIYAPQLRILDEDLLPRFPAAARAEAEGLRLKLSPLLPLR